MLTGRGHWLWDQGCEGHAFLLGGGGTPRGTSWERPAQFVCLWRLWYIRAWALLQGMESAAETKKMARKLQSLPQACQAAALLPTP